MKIVIPGGSGQVGSILARHFHAQGHDVVVLSRKAAAAPWRVVTWDAVHLDSWRNELDDADAVINLAGRSVNCRYSPKHRREILASRVESTRVVGQAIANAARPPRVWLQASSATIYAHRYDAPNDERTGLLAGGEPDVPDSWRFGVDVTNAWEEAFHSIPTPQTRKVAMRTTMVMSPDRGGIFAVLLGLVRRRLGGRVGDGRQYVSWIHDRDFIRAVEFLVAQDLDGPVNLAAPEPLPNAEFMRTLRQEWGVRFGLPASRWMLEIGTWFLRTESELVLKSRRVIPGRLLEKGFSFCFPNWREAARDLCRRWRERT